MRSGNDPQNSLNVFRPDSATGTAVIAASDSEAEIKQVERAEALLHSDGEAEINRNDAFERLLYRDCLPLFLYPRFEPAGSFCLRRSYKPKAIHGTNPADFLPQGYPAFFHIHVPGPLESSASDV